MILARRDRPRKTVEDFMNLPEGTRAELIDGDLFMSPSPRPKHQAVAGKLFRLLADHVDHHNLGVVYTAPLDVYLPSGDIVQPDVLFIAKPHLGIVQDWVRGIPDLVVEVLSPDRHERDRIVKRDLYAHNAIPEYWIVDPETASVEMFTVHGDRYQSSGYFAKGDIVTSAVLPDFKVPAATVFPGPP